MKNHHRWYTEFLISRHLTLVGCRVEPYDPYPLSTPAKGRLTCCHVVAGQARGVIIPSDIQNHFSSLALARYQGGAPNDRIRSALLRHSRDGPSAALGFSRPKKKPFWRAALGWIVAEEIVLFPRFPSNPDPLMCLAPWARPTSCQMCDPALRPRGYIETPVRWRQKEFSAPRSGLGRVHRRDDPSRVGGYFRRPCYHSFMESCHHHDPFASSHTSAIYLRRKEYPGPGNSGMDGTWSNISGSQSFRGSELAMSSV